MNWIIWLIIFQEVAVCAVGYVRKISLTHYIKKRGYKVKTKPVRVRISDFILNRIRFAVPGYGLLMLLIMLFASEETIFKAALRNDMLEPMGEEN